MNIHFFPHPILIHPCKPLIKVDDFIRECIKEMQEFIFGSTVGLAASQVGLPYSFFVTALKECPVVINPIIHGHGGLDNKQEGCVSVPGLSLSVRRNNKVKLTGYDLDGNDINLNLSGFPARVIQHEVDHCNGKLFIEKCVNNPMDYIGILDSLKEKFDSSFDHDSWAKRIEILERERCKVEEVVLV